MNWLPQPKSGWREEIVQLMDDLDTGAPADVCERVASLARIQSSPAEDLLLGRLAKKLSSCDVAAGSFRRLKVGLVGDHNLAFLASALPRAALSRGLLVEVTAASYDSLAPFSYGLHAPFPDTLDALVAMFDLSSLGGGSLLDHEVASQAGSDFDQLLERLRRQAERLGGAQLILATLQEHLGVSSSADWAMAGSPLRRARAANDLIAAGAEAGRWLPWDISELSGRLGLDEWRDRRQFHLSKAPFAIHLVTRSADHLCALLAARFGKAPRAIVLDLDNTLWGGVVADDGLGGIRVGQGSAEGEAFIAFQQYILDLRSRGYVLCVCSKNEDAIAREPFLSHPDMVLRLEHFALFQANWQDKATNIANIALKLRLAPDAIVFLDDNPAERDRVRQSLPGVYVPEIGDDPSRFVDDVSGSRLFEQIPLTDDDKRRADSYGRGASSVESSLNIGDYDAYLESLKMTLTLSPFDDHGMARISQLINKSNQFNLTTRRYSEGDLRALGASDSVMTIQARLSDRHADHGMIAVIIARLTGRRLLIDTWLQSCRILERGVESALMDEVFRLAQSHGVEEVIGEYIPTERNGLVKEFFPSFGFEKSDGDEISTRYKRLVIEWQNRPHHLEVALSQ